MKRKQFKDYKKWQRLDSKFGSFKGMVNQPLRN